MWSPPDPSALAASKARVPGCVPEHIPMGADGTPRDHQVWFQKLSSVPFKATWINRFSHHFRLAHLRFERFSNEQGVFTTQQEERFTSVKLCCGSVERSLISSSSRSLYFDQEQILQKYFIGFSGITCSNEVKRNWPWNCKIDLDWQPLLYLLSALMKAKWYFNEITTGQVQGDWHVDSQHSLFIRLLAFRYLSIHHTLCKQQWILAPHAFP